MAPAASAPVPPTPSTNPASPPVPASAPSAASASVPPTPSTNPASPPVPASGPLAASAPVPPTPSTNPAPPATPAPPAVPAPAPGAAPAPVPPAAPAPAAARGWETRPGGPPAGHQPTEAGGQVRLPAGAPVPVPGAGPGTAAADAAHAAVAVLLIGPAGAGKTTVARHWADTRRVPTAHISLDDVREWVRSGFADPQSGWNDHSEAQYRLARRTCGFAARNFLANGISCILDDAVFPDRPVVGLGGWKRHVGPGLLPVVLLPGLEVVLERNAARSGNRRLGDEEVARIHGRMAGWYGSGLPIIDNTQQDVATTARLLDDVVARSLASPPSW
ncbi:AAA family ATPase [Streptomyces varsoviensis]|uniref:AAA family ATPase n=1 Tax=Streptomyces varsoviensis TaxID=67373 RepID=UPI003F4D4A3F